MRRYCLILLSAFVVLSTSIFAQNALSKKEVKDVVEKYFIRQDIPTRYYSNILIRIDGEITQADSVFLNKLIDNLSAHIAKWDVVLISEGTSNLILSVNLPQSESYPQERLGNRRQVEIIKKREPISIPEEATQQERNKILYYNLMKNLVKYSKEKEVRAIIPETVFALNKPENVIINNPIDFQIIDEIYSMEYDNRLDNPTKRLEGAAKNRQILIIATLLSNIVVTLLLLWMFLLGIFKNHNYIFTEYFKQGIIVLFAFIVGIVILIFISMVFMASESGVAPIQFYAPLIVIIFVCLVLGIFILLFLYISERLILRENKSVFLNVVFPFLTTTIVPTSLFYILVELSPTNTKLPTIDKQNLMLTILSIPMSIAFYRAFLIFISRKSESIINQKDVELARMSEMHRKAELQSLRAKINPHFLYNSLNSIASLASIDSNKTEQMALSLSDFFKYSINREQKQTNPLSDELTAVETYLEIERVRFGDRLTYSVECPESLKSVQIPQLLIQPLVENAVKHGVSKLLKDGVVRIVISELESMKISIRVYDNGPDFPDGPMSGFGIRNTHDRLQLLYDDKASLNWKNQPEKYFELILPKHPVIIDLESSQYPTEISNPTQPHRTNTSSVRKIMNILWGISAFLVLMGATFKVQHYPNGSEILAIGFIVGLIMAIFEIIRLIITLKDKE